MAGMTYVLDTKVISDLLKRNINVYARLQSHRKQDDTLYICQPVHFEVVRGLRWVGATAQLRVLQNDFLPLFRWIALLDEDWDRAAHF